MADSKQDQGGELASKRIVNYAEAHFGEAGAKNLHLEEGESMTLSPTSRAFKQYFRQVRPQSIEEVRKILGPTLATKGNSASRQPICCRKPELASTLISLEDLESKDPEVKAQARALAYTAAHEYVRADDTTHLSHWTAVLDRYVVSNQAVLNVVLLSDIEVERGATLTISRTTHALYANNIRMYGNGKIVCQGPTTFRVTTVQGRLTRLAVSVDTGGTHFVGSV